MSVIRPDPKNEARKYENSISRPEGLIFWLLGRYGVKDRWVVEERNRRRDQKRFENFLPLIYCVP
jgi:hypothetical protein